MTEDERKRLRQSMTESQQQADTLRNQYMNRGEFSWNPNTDEGFQNYAKLMKQQGNLAMKDTMAKASAMTGGYGNSYAATAGQQMYNQYLGQVDQKANDYYAMALDAFNREGNDLLSKYQLASQNAADAEGRLLEDASIRAQYGDYADYIGMLGISEEDYKNANLADPTEEQIQGYIDARNKGDGDNYADMLAGLGVDPGYLDNYADMHAYSGGYDVKKLRNSAVINNALNLPKEFKMGAKFSVSRRKADKHKTGDKTTGDNWDLMIGRMVDNPAITEAAKNADGYVFMYDGAAYITDGVNVYEVDENPKKVDEYEAFIAQLES